MIYLQKLQAILLEELLLKRYELGYVFWTEKITSLTWVSIDFNFLCEYFSNYVGNYTNFSLPTNAICWLEDMTLLERKPSYSSWII